MAANSTLKITVWLMLAVVTSSQALSKQIQLEGELAKQANGAMQISKSNDDKVLSQSFVSAAVSSHDINSNANSNTAPSFGATFPRIALETMLANITTQDTGSGLWVLIPSNLSETQLHESDFSLFKLNTNQLFSGNWPGEVTGVDGESGFQAPGAVPLEATSLREARKFGLFSNVLNKPKVSPLYLVNGTVCRFVNSQPICTTLSTTGLFRGQPINNQPFLNNNNQPFPNNPNVNPSTNPNNNNPNNNGPVNNLFNQQQNGNNPQLVPNQRQVSPPNTQGQNFQANQQQNNNIQPFRQAALMSDGTQDINLANVSESSLQQRRQPVKGQTAQYVVNRRPASLLSLAARPFRSG